MSSSNTSLEKIVKRDGSIVPFDINKIKYAVRKALVVTDVDISEECPLASTITDAVCARLPSFPTVEQCQDIVEEELMKAGLTKTAKAYILYREKRSHLREKAISETWREECKKAVKYFPTVYNYIVYLRTYSKFLDDKGRRETWPETVTRFMDFMRECLGDKLSHEEYREIEEAILRMDVLPSMRMLQFAGETVRRNNICAYNCAYVTPNKIEAFRDALMILMSGSGQGFSVEKKYVDQLPIIKKQTGEVLPMHVIEDSREGWVNAFYLGLKTWYDGKDITFDYSKVRPSGARLKTSGGRASGPEPLKNLLNFARQIILAKQESRLSTINVHDLMCKIGVIVLVGGCRRCIPPNSRILTKTGSFKTIEQIEVGDNVLTNNGWKPVVNVFEQGKQEVIKIKHINGSFECTPNHRMAVLTDAFGNFRWKEAGELKEGDILGFPMFDKDGKRLAKKKVYVNRMPEFTYVKPKNSTTCKDITIPELDREMAWLIGHFQGNGYVQLTSEAGQLEVVVHGDKREEAEFITEQLKRFGINVEILEPNKNDHCFRIRVNSVQLAVYFHEHVKQPKTSMNVPQFIKNASKNIKAAYLQGLLDANECVKGSFILVTTVYEEYAKDIQNLCYSMNIISRVVFRKENQWDVEIKNIHDKELFYVLTEGIGYKKVEKLPSTWNKKSDLAAYDTPFVPITVKEVINENKIVDTYDIEVEGDHCFVCEGVLTHNSSEISLSDLDDEDMRNAKMGAFWNTHPDRVMANNSAVYNRTPTDEELLKEWTSLVESKSGERGITSRSHLHEQLPQRRLEVIGNRVYDMGTNPCVTGSTWVMTVEGPRQVKDLIDKRIDLIINGKAYSMKSEGFFETGTKEVFELVTHKGYRLYLTADHPLMQYKGTDLIKTKLKDLDIGDEILLSNHRNFTEWEGPGTFGEGWLIGQMVGNGTIVNDKYSSKRNKAYCKFWGEDAKEMCELALEYMKECCTFRKNVKVCHVKHDDSYMVGCKDFLRLAQSFGISMKKNLFPDIEKTSSEFHKGFLRGFFDADGCVTGTKTTGYSVRLSQNNLWRLRVTQRMLLRLGIVSTIYQERKKAGTEMMPDGKGGKKEYNVKAVHELYIGSENIKIYNEIVGFHKPDKAQKLQDIIDSGRKFKPEPFKDKIESIELCNETVVYDVTVAKVHEFCANGIRVSNCVEVNLIPYEFCNLTNVTIRPHDNRESMLKNIRLATILGTFQTTLDNFPVISPEWKENVTLERLLGVSLTGMRDCRYIDENIEVLDELRKYSIEVNIHYADRFGINRSTAITTVKPCGTSAEMLGTASGIHARFAPYYIRRIRISATDPLAKLLIDQGVPYNPENGQVPPNVNTWVFEFPQKSPEGSVMLSDLTAIDQLNYWKEVKTRYTEHNPSTTIHVKEGEWITILKWLRDNWNIVGGLSFLPYSDHVYTLAPYEAISKDEYEKRTREFPEIDFAKLVLYEKSDTTERKTQWACVGDKCNM